MGLTHSLNTTVDRVSSDLAAARESTMKQMANNQRNMQLKLRETQLATQLAIMRDNFLWFSAFYATATSACIGHAVRTGSRGALVPVVPLTFLLAFQYDMVYGGKMARVRDGAERILAFERERLSLPRNTAVVESREEYEKIFTEK
jgi:hypothetical protein